MKRIVFLVDRYTTSDAAGAAVAIRSLYDALIESYDIHILCGYADDLRNEKRKILEVTPKEAQMYIKTWNIDIIHYFKATGRRFFSGVMSCLKNENIHKTILTTICQKPSYYGLELSPLEIAESNCLIFIDKAAYDDVFYKFIPQKKKKLIYFGYTEAHALLIDIIRSGQSIENHEFIHFGRGSSLNKCHKDMIKVFDRINTPMPKRFTFIGGRKLPKLLQKQIKDRVDVEWKPAMAYQDWLKNCATFDVFLYQLPENAYSSIDGTLGDAMLLGIPPIVYGPAAIKERINHGEDGFIAESIEEMVEYANILSNDSVLRKKMGQSARKSTLKRFPFF